MNIYEKLQTARIKLQSVKLAKSGNNKFAGYNYFELGDFLPTVQNIFAELKMIGVVSFGETATLTIIDMEKPDLKIVIQSPMSSAALKGCHDVQNLGAVQTYLRRYLWVTAMEIVEHDALDATTGKGNEPKDDSSAEERFLIKQYEEAAAGGMASLQSWHSMVKGAELKKKIWAAHGDRLKKIANEVKAAA